MSLDISLGVEYCKQCNRSNEVYSSNITHNLTDMAEALGVYEIIWNPEENGIETAGQLIKPLDKAIKEILKNPKKYQKYNPKNGWGNYNGFVRFLENLLQACKQNPDTKVITDK